MSDLISRGALILYLNDIALSISGQRSKLEEYDTLQGVMRCIEGQPAVDAVPTSSLIELRDWLVEHDAITIEGRRWLDNLIGGGDNGA